MSDGSEPDWDDYNIYRFAVQSSATEASTPDDEEPDDHGCRLYEFLVCSVVIGLFCVFGLVGNVTSFVVFCKHKSDTVAAIFLLQCMAVFDSLLLVVSLIVYAFPSVYPYTGRLKAVYDSFDMILYVWPPAMMFHTVTVWLTVLVTVNRYNAVCRAIEEFGAKTIRRTRAQVVVVVSLAVVYNVPRFFEHKVIYYTSVNSSLIATDDVDNSSTSDPLLPPSSASSSTVTTEVHLGDSQVYQIVYSIVFYYPVMYILPLASLSTLNVRLIAALNALKRRTSTLSTSLPASPAVASSRPGAAAAAGGAAAPLQNRRRRRRRDDNITQCVVAIVCVFIVCQTPALFNQIFWALLPSEDRECGRFHFYYTKLSDLLVVVNSSCNFVIYCLFGRTFRRIFVSTICCRARDPRRGDTLGGGRETLRMTDAAGGGGGGPFSRHPLDSVTPYRVNNRSPRHGSGGSGGSGNHLMATPPTDFISNVVSAT